MSTLTLPVNLSKSKYLAGLQCPRRLWWEVHEANAPELILGVALQARFAEGQQVTAKAREVLAGGVLVQGWSNAGRVRATQAALAQGATCVYEGTFSFRGTVVRADILRQVDGRWVLCEVKSSTRVKEEHYPDVAVQLLVLRGAGLDVSGVEIMHLNRECRYPDLSNLFVSPDVTPEAEALLPEVDTNLKAFAALLEGPLPAAEAGRHCSKPYPVQ
jgi:hypothetical protein